MHILLTVVIRVLGSIGKGSAVIEVPDMDAAADIAGSVAAQAVIKGGVIESVSLLEVPKDYEVEDD